MTTPNHAIGTFLLTKAMGLPTALCLYMGFSSMMPDVIGYLEKLLKKDPHAWGWYNYCHRFHFWQLLFPEWLLHIGLDWPLHTGSGWRITAYYIEALLWVAYLIIFFWQVI